MDYKLEWLTEQEGRIVFFEEENTFLAAQFFITGEEEAEFRLQDIVFLEEITDIDNIPEEIIQKMTKCISECFRLLWEEGLEETVLMEDGKSKVAEILDSTEVVKLAYTEWIMKCHLEVQKSTGCGLVNLKLTKNEDGFAVENKDKSFFCRIMEYKTESVKDQKFYLYEVEVKKKKRSQGIATACLTELFQYLSKDTSVTVLLQVGSYNEPAVHLYKKLGFEVSEELRYYAMEEEY